MPLQSIYLRIQPTQRYERTARSIFVAELPKLPFSHAAAALRPSAAPHPLLTSARSRTAPHLPGSASPRAARPARRRLPTPLPRQRAGGARPGSLRVRRGHSAERPRAHAGKSAGCVRCRARRQVVTPPGSLSLPLGWAPPDALGVPEGCGKAAERRLGVGGMQTGWCFPNPPTPPSAPPEQGHSTRQRLEGGAK